MRTRTGTVTTGEWGYGLWGILTNSQSNVKAARGREKTEQNRVLEGRERINEMGRRGNMHIEPREVNSRRPVNSYMYKYTYMYTSSYSYLCMNYVSLKSRPRPKPLSHSAVGYT